MSAYTHIFMLAVIFLQSLCESATYAILVKHKISFVQDPEVTVVGEVAGPTSGGPTAAAGKRRGFRDLWRDVVVHEEVDDARVRVRREQNMWK